MQLRQTIPSHNVESILQEGPGPVYAVTLSDKKYVWLHTPRKTPWAIRHTVRRKQVSEDEVVILEVNVPRTWLWRDQVRGVEVSGPDPASSSTCVGGNRK